MTTPSPTRESAPPRRRAALFDMDRTLVRKNTPQLYTKFQRDIGEVGWLHTAKVAWWIAKYTTGFADVYSIARAALAEYRGTDEAEHAAKCRQWFPQYVLPHVAEEGRRAVEGHREQGDLLAIVTGSTRYATEPLAKELGIVHCVCSETEIDQAGKFTGQVVEPLCFREGKLSRALAFLRAHHVEPEDATFYSDSVTDLPLMAAVGRAVAVNPDPRLRRAAEKRGWAILRW